MTLTEYYFRRLLRGIGVKKKRCNESFAEVQGRAAVTHLFYALYIINKVYSRNWSDLYLKGVAEDIVYRVFNKKINPYTFDMGQKKVSKDKSVILTRAYRIWLRGYKLMSELKGTNVSGETYWFDYWHEQIKRHRNEGE